MEKLLQWAILNSATENEDAPKSINPANPEKIDPAVIHAILGKPVSEQMLEIMDYLEKPDSPVDGKVNELDNLEMLVEQIDNASNLEPLGMWPRILSLLDSKEADVIVGALWVVGTALQHNPQAQKAFDAHQGLDKLLQVFETTQSAGVKAKALYAISALLRNNLRGFSHFIQLGGIAVLLKTLSDSKITKRVVFLLLALVNESSDTFASSEFKPPKTFPLALIDAGILPQLLQTTLQILKNDGSDDELETPLLLISALAQAAFSDPDSSKSLLNASLDAKLLDNFNEQLPNLEKRLAESSLTAQDWSNISKVTKRN